MKLGLYLLVIFKNVCFQKELIGWGVSAIGRVAGSAFERLTKVGVGLFMGFVALHDII